LFRASLGNLSPNGRLFSVGGENRIKIKSVEAGDVIVEIPSSRSYELHWLDNTSAIFNQIDSGNKVILLDFQSGTQSTLTGIQGPITKVAHVPDNKNQYILASYRAISKIEIAHTPQGPEINLIDEKPLSGGAWANNTSGQTADGTTVFNASRELTLMPLESMEEEKISFLPFQIQSGVATSDPDTLLITGFMQGNSSWSGRHYLYSIGNRSLIPIDRNKLKSERFVYVPVLKSLAVIADSKIELLDELPTGEPIELSKFVGDAVLQESLRKLEAMDRQAAMMQNRGWPAPMPAPQSAWGRAAIPAPAAAPAPMAPAAYGTTGPVGELVYDAQIEAVGVYQGANATLRSGEARRVGNVRVSVRRSSKPIVLVLSSYEPVRWMVLPEPGARISAILLSSYYQSQVIGASSARTVMLGRGYAYQRESSEYRSLENEVFRLTGKRISLFQGRYEGSEFSVGGN